MAVQCLPPRTRPRQSLAQAFAEAERRMAKDALSKDELELWEARRNCRQDWWIRALRWMVSA